MEGGRHPSAKLREALPQRFCGLEKGFRPVQRKRFFAGPSPRRFSQRGSPTSGKGKRQRNFDFPQLLIKTERFRPVSHADESPLPLGANLSAMKIVHQSGSSKTSDFHFCGIGKERNGQANRSTENRIVRRMTLSNRTLGNIADKARTRRRFPSRPKVVLALSGLTARIRKAVRKE